MSEIIDVTTEIKKDMISQVSNLTKQQQLEIFYILSEQNIDYTENNNGVYINLDNVDNKILNKVLIYIDFCKRSNSILINKTANLLVPPEPSIKKDDGKVIFNDAISKIVSNKDEDNESDDENNIMKVTKNCKIDMEDNSDDDIESENWISENDNEDD